MASNRDPRFFERRLTRRGFVGGSLGLLAGGGLLAACGGDDDEGEAAPAPPPAETAAPPPPAGETTAPPAETGLPRGGTLRTSTASPPFGFDPAVWWYSTTWASAYIVHDRLLEVAADGKSMVPGLAELPTVNQDGTLYSFSLRPGTTFSHGRPVTADDVKFSLERMLNPATEGQGAGLYTGLTILGMEDFVNERADTIGGIRVVDDQTIEFEFEQPDSVFLYILGLGFASILPRDATEGATKEDVNWRPVGSGPYVIVEVDPESRAVFERRTDVWLEGTRDPGFGYADRIEWEFGIDPELAILRIQNGELDMMEEGIPSGSIAQLRDNPETAEQVYIDTENNVLYFTMSLKHEALSDLRVRQALAHAIDKERYARAIAGLGEVAVGGLFSPLSPYYQDGLAYPYDPARATELLAEAGFGDGFELPFPAANYTPWSEMAQTVKQDLEQIGVTANVEELSREAWGTTNVEDHPVGLVQNQWELPYPHGSYVMDSAFGKPGLGPGACCNWSEFDDPAFNDLIAQAHLATEESQIVELYKEMDRIVVQEQALWVPMVYPKVAMLVSSRVHGYEIPASPLGIQKFFGRYAVEEA
jgi:ABC-type transport system substrate-binding protein